MKDKNTKKLRILELCQFSSGVCGVWARVKEESLRLSKKGYEIRVFSSNAIKGSSGTACDQETIQNIKIQRFPFIKLGGESFMKWNFQEQALDYSPDIIICHSYRHNHTTQALRIKKLLEKKGKICKVFLVTHAPFARESTRTFIQKNVVKFYDIFIGKRTINQFDKIIAITQWEIPYLRKIGASPSKIEYIPNGIPEEFFYLKSKTKEQNKILFLGRISPIKNLEVMIRAMSLIKDNKIIFEIVGPSEEEYKKKLNSLITHLNIKKRIKFSPAIHNLKEKIDKIDSCKIFVLPSKSEGMPQSLIEAMARSRVVIGNDIPAVRDLIKNKKNGYIFEKDEKSLAILIDRILEKDNGSVKKQARSSVKQFSWNSLINKIDSLF